MPLIRDQDQAKLRELFAERLTGDISITYYAPNDSPLVLPGRPEPAPHAGPEIRQLLEELGELTDRINLTVENYWPGAAGAIPRAPAFVLEGNTRGRVRFFGMPSGYEFMTLIEDLIDVADGDPELTDETRDLLADLDQDVHIQVFVTPT